MTGQNGGSITVSPALVRDLFYVLALAASGGVFYAQQAGHSEKILKLERTVEDQQKRIADLEAARKVVETEQSEQNRRIESLERQLVSHEANDVYRSALHK